MKLWGGFAAAFCIIVLFAAFLLIPDRETSPLENRTLTQTPQFSLKAFVDGSFQKELDSYVSDQFPFRDLFVNADMTLDRLGQTTVSADYEYRVEGADGYDYYVYEDGLILSLYRDKKNLDVAELWRDKLTQAADWCADAGVDMTVAIFPSKAEAMIPMEPIFHQNNADNDVLQRIFTALPDSVFKLDGVEEFRKQPVSELRTRYFKTDNHWNFYGAQCAYEWMWPRLAEQLDLTVSSHTFTATPNVQQSMVGAYSRSVGLGALQEETIEFYLPDEDPTYDSYEIWLDGEQTEVNKVFGTVLEGDEVSYSTLTMWNNGHVKIRNENADNDYVLLVIHDSFYNAMALNMSLFVSEQHIVDTRSYENFNLAEFVRENHVDGVLFFYNSNVFYKLAEHLQFDIQ